MAHQGTVQEHSPVLNSLFRVVHTAQPALPVSSSNSELSGGHIEGFISNACWSQVSMQQRLRELKLTHGTVNCLRSWMLGGDQVSHPCQEVACPLRKNDIWI